MTEKELPTVATFTLNPDYSQGIIWERYSDKQPEMEEGNELVRRKDVVEYLEDKLSQAKSTADKQASKLEGPTTRVMTQISILEEILQEVKVDE